MSQTDQKCVTTCKSYGAANYSKDDYDECSDAWAAAGCPADGVSFNKPDPCENSTEPPSAAETAAGTAVAPGTRDNTLGVRQPTTTTTTAEPEATTTTMAEPETTTTFTGTRVPCTTSCEKEFANCFHWHGKKKTPEEAYSQCRGEIDEAYWRLKDEGCIPFCLSTNSMCEGHEGCSNNETGTLGLVQTRTWARKSTLFESEEKEAVQRTQAQANTDPDIAEFLEETREDEVSQGCPSFCGKVFNGTHPNKCFM